MSNRYMTYPICRLRYLRPNFLILYSQYPNSGPEFRNMIKWPEYDALKKGWYSYRNSGVWCHTKTRDKTEFRRSSPEFGPERNHLVPSGGLGLEWKNGKGNIDCHWSVLPRTYCYPQSSFSQWRWHSNNSNSNVIHTLYNIILIRALLLVYC